jgi:glycosyltransferase involved in cell wall biosynthesis
MTAGVIVDVAGGPFGGAARFRAEVYRYLARTGRDDVKVIGAERRVDPAWLVRRELAGPPAARRVALNNVGFVSPGGERWTLVANSWDFVTDEEAAKLSLSDRAEIRCRSSVVRMAARRSDVIVAPCTDMAERITRVLPSVTSRVIVRMHPVSPEPVPDSRTSPIILCPVLFYPIKRMHERVMDWIEAIDKHLPPEVRMLVTAERSEVSAELATNPRIELVGRLDLDRLNRLWAISRAIYFPTSVESFGYPLAEARVNGQPVIALDTPQNHEIAGQALCGFIRGDLDSLRQATEDALKNEIKPDPSPFDPDAYFSWILGPSR